MVKSVLERNMQKRRKINSTYKEIKRKKINRKKGKLLQFWVNLRREGQLSEKN
jgi:hypothetical protein